MSVDKSPQPAVQFLSVPDDVAGQRIDNFLLTALKGAPRTLIYRILRKGEVRVNKGRIKPEYRLQIGDIIRVPPIRLSPEDANPVRPAQGAVKDLATRIIYEQDGLLVLNKPAGLAVHGGSGVAWGVIEALRVLRPDEPNIELIHRLDKDTSGLLMVAQKRSVLRAYHELLRDGKMEKVYVALLVGRLKGSTHKVDAPLHKNTLPNGERMMRVSREGKEALTEFRVIEHIGNFTLVEARPKTGRTHQIRVHAQHLGHPLVADEKYGNDAINKEMRAFGATRLFLHARELKIPLAGQDKKLSLLCDIEPDLDEVLERLRHVRY